MKETQLFVYGCSIEKRMLDELGHANYNALKEVFEDVRHRLCKFLGFGRKTLKDRLGLGLVMIEDHYRYLRQLKAGDRIFFLADITVDSPIRLTITLRVTVTSDSSRLVSELTNEAVYQMAMINLATGKAVRIPKPILRSIEQFKVSQATGT